MTIDPTWTHADHQESQQDGPGTAVATLPQLDVDQSGQQRGWTILLRLLLVIPHGIALGLVGLAALLVLICGWWVALFTGRLPSWIQVFLSGYVLWSVRVNAYFFLLTDAYPPFPLSARPDYPVRIELPAGQLGRWSVLLRGLLILPVYLLVGVLIRGWQLCAVFIWIAVLITGRTPVPVFGASAALLRFTLRMQAYAMLLSNRYPQRLFGDPQAPVIPDTEGGVTDIRFASHSSTRPLVLTPGGRALVITMLLVGILGTITSSLLSGTQGMEPAPGQAPSSSLVVDTY